MRTFRSQSASVDYVARVNRAIDYVNRHLADNIRLADVARAAHFSPFHFHRVFRILTGETLNEFVKRVRLERSLSLLNRRRDLSLTDVALACGFSSSSDYSRSFRQRYGVPPSRFDLRAHRERQREQLEGGARRDRSEARMMGLPPGENPDGFAVDIREIEPFTVAYVRVADSYREGGVVAAAHALLEWAGQRNIADGQWLGYMWDDPEIVALADCRYDVAVVAKHVQPSGSVGRAEFPAMRVACVAIRGGIDLELRALDWLFRTWLPSSGYVPADLPCFEAWCSKPFAHGVEHFELDIWLPVEHASRPSRAR